MGQTFYTGTSSSRFIFMESDTILSFFCEIKISVQNVLTKKCSSLYIIIIATVYIYKDDKLVLPIPPPYVHALHVDP